MVIARLSREHHVSQAQAQHQFLQQQQQERGVQAAVFKVPTCSTQEPTAKRKLGEAFSTDETMLSLSCGFKQPRPRGSKLTIFYAGSVYVFDNVPEETARALMTLAASKALKPPAAAAAAKNSILNGARAGAGSSNSIINAFAGGSSSSSSSSASSTSCCLSLADITNSSPESNKVNRGAEKNSTTEFVFPVLPNADTNVSSNGSKPSSSSSSSVPTATKETSITTTTTTTTTNVNPRMGMLPAWVLAALPQARRNSVQRFLQTRRGKLVQSDLGPDLASTD